MRRLRDRSGLLRGALVFCAVGLTYANHFHNGYHFDDFHSINDNVFVQDIANLPRFFTDPTTSSSLPTHRTWRPVVTASLAIDYWLGRGYSPLYFHISTFVWFLAQLVCMYLLFAGILRATWAAWFAVAWYGLHPAVAETVNYVIQRAEVISTCGVVAGLALYARYPALRRYGIYLAPVVVALLAKPPALVFPLLLVAYEVWCGNQDQGRRLSRAARKAIPAFVVAVAFVVLQTAMTPKTLATGGSAYSYLITQPYVAFRYFTSFFLPLHLSADTDLAAFGSFWTVEAFGGFIFLAALIYGIYAFSREPSTRPIAFGLAWFVLAMIPTSVFPLAEVENDHRMFFPFVGLTLAVTSAGSLLLGNLLRRDTRAAVAAGTACLFLLLALGTRRRNEVWRTEESLWEDVTVKSPRNGRGWMNYGLTQMSKGQVESALRLFEHAAVYLPNYPFLEINLGISNAALHRDGEASAHFHRAMELDSQMADCYYYYGRWLREKGQMDEAASVLKKAFALSPASLDARHLLLGIYADRGPWADLQALAADTLKLSPRDEIAARYRDTAPQGTPQLFLAVSLRKYQAQDYRGCIDAAKQALRVDPQYAEAYNNIAAAYSAMREWDQAIEAAEHAVRIRPDFQLARNNLAWARSEKERQGSAGPSPGKSEAVRVR